MQAMLIQLRLRHLMFYDDAEQIEVRHVLSLEHFEVDVYGGGEVLMEGELFVKRNCIRLRRTPSSNQSEIVADSRPFFLFSDNCSGKEDFYHVLLQNQRRSSSAPNLDTVPLQFESAHMAKLVQLLHKSGDNIQTRWINALIGRIFLSIYKTEDAELFIRSKILKKLTRVQTPAFIRDITVGRITMGDSAPLITNPKLRELTIDGDLTLEADIRYRGSFRLEIMALARLDLGPRFKARELNLRLAGICRSLDGHLFIRIKPPPSNRLWISFETMPKVDISVEPVVSSRQITYGVILRAIESRIRDTIADTLVMPNWDDVPFKDTFGQTPRGGLWQAVHGTPGAVERDQQDSAPTEAPNTLNHDTDITDDDAPETGLDMSGDDSTQSLIADEASSFPSMEPSITTDAATLVSEDRSISLNDSSDAESASLEEAPHASDRQDKVDSPSTGSKSGRWTLRRKPIRSVASQSTSLSVSSDPIRSRAPEVSKVDSGLKKRAVRSGLSGDTDATAHHNASEQSISNKAPSQPPSEPVQPSDPPHSPREQPSGPLSSKPIGRGRPLPPPGTPLPGPNRPNKFGWASPLGLMKRRNVSGSARNAHLAPPGVSNSLPNLSASGPHSPSAKDVETASSGRGSSSSSTHTSVVEEKPALPPRSRGPSVAEQTREEQPRHAEHGRDRDPGDAGDAADGLLVIQAPESGRDSPVSDMDALVSEGGHIEMGEGQDDGAEAEAEAEVLAEVEAEVKAETKGERERTEEHQAVEPTAEHDARSQGQTA